MAVVTGASKGIGASIAKALADECASVVVNYASSKQGADRVLAKELGPRKIRVNSINPGMIETEGVHAAGFVGSDFQKMVETQAPLGRVGQPDDIPPTTVYLASSDSKYMTGETLLVSGGLK